MWATENEALEEWRNRTLSPAEYEEKLYEEWCYEQMLAEMWAEDGYVRMMESGSHYLGEPDWAM